MHPLMVRLTAAIGFPIVIFLLVPVRMYVLPRVFTPAELAVLDGPAASPFVSAVQAPEHARILIAHTDHGIRRRQCSLSGRFRVTKEHPLWPTLRELDLRRR
jgi:hypothetical protein